MNRKEFILIAEIDYLYWELHQLFERYRIPRKPLEFMIDEACRYDPFKNQVKDAIKILEMINKRKKKLGVNITESVNAIKQLKNKVEDTP